MMTNELLNELATEANKISSVAKPLLRERLNRFGHAALMLVWSLKHPDAKASDSCFGDCGQVWDECINSYNEPEPRSKWWARTAYILLLASAFLLGRAYGWYEVHLYMKHMAEGLAALAGSLK